MSRHEHIQYLQKHRKRQKELRKRQTDFQRKVQREKKHLQRLLKRTGLSYNSDILDVDQYNFNCYMKSLQWVECPICEKRAIHNTMKKFRCTRNCKKFNTDNDMNPLSVPHELQNLTFIEKQLISRVHSVISLYKVKKMQYKYSGQVVNFTQNVQEVADVLPHAITDLNNIVVVKLKTKSTLKDFVVRRDVVLRALLWLKKNNPHYNNIKISSERLNSLGIESNVYDKLLSFNQKDNEDSSNVEQDTDNSEDDDDTEDIITHTSVPDSHNSSVTKSFTNEIVWPSIGKTPLNEFTTPGYMSMAFPHLFCYGTCDYSLTGEKKVSLTDYIHHLMLYKDQRFAKDERFRYFIMNSEMRWKSLNLGNIYVKKTSIFSKMTVLQLKTYFKENPWIVNHIMHYGSRLRTTKAYWNSRCSELLDMVNQLGTPTIFFTLSSADYHWPDLYRLLGHDIKSLSVAERGRILAENPLVADTFFYLRATFFLNNSFSNHFKVKDIWYRYEFQHRGSIHLHGIAWFHGAPEISEEMTEIQKKEVLEYYNNIISCTNPDMHILPLETHPCQRSLDEIEDKSTDLCQLINQLQRHTKCSKLHCLRKSGKEKTLKCRHNFPKELMSETSFKVDNKKIVDIDFIRNDAFVNKYNEWVLQTWRSNIDFSPILSKEVVYRYIAKYASKSEVKSLCYNDVLTQIVNKTSDDSESAKKAIRKLLVSTCGERDYCAQEVMHFVMGYRFYHSSRDFVVVNFKSLDWISVAQDFSTTNIFDLYKQRSRKREKISLFEFAKNFQLLKGEVVRRPKSAIVRVFPRLEYSLDQDYRDQQLAKLFYPWRHLEDVSIIDNDMKKHINVVYEQSVTNPNVIDNLDTEGYDENNDFDRATDKDTDQSILSSYNPNMYTDNDMKVRNRDLSFNWHYLCEKLQKDSVIEVYEKILTRSKIKETFNVNDQLLNKSQKNVYLKIKEITNLLVKRNPVKHNFIIVQGMAGTGKTYLLQCCKNYINLKLGHEAVKVIAPTGVAAKLVGGTTIHSFLSLGRYTSRATRLSGVELINFKQKHNGLKFIFLDEFSMCGLRLLSTLEHRCKDLTGCESLFGNLTVVFFGDVNQLLPVIDQPLFSEVDVLSQHNGLVERGKVIMTEVTDAFVLKECHRFANKEYVSFLRKVATGRCTSKEVVRLKKRTIGVMKTSDEEKFKDSLTICSTNELAFNKNKQKLQELKKPIAYIKAKNNNRTAFQSSDDLAEGLVNVLAVAIGAKVMLRRNLNVNRGLVNGSIGVVKHILYEKDSKPPSLPICLLIHFESVDLIDLNIKYVPIIPVQSQWNKSGISCTRYQLPLTLCWACTIHKSQGLTLLRIILDAGSSEFALGLLYVALSRVPDFESLCLLTSLTLERLNSCTASAKFKARRRFLKKLKQMSKIEKH